MHAHYLPIIVAALAILILGCLNPVVLQSTQNGKPSGHPSYLWLSMISLLAGLLTCYLNHPGSKKGKTMFDVEYL